jgi:hypothetical protein
MGYGHLNIDEREVILKMQAQQASPKTSVPGSIVAGNFGWSDWGALQVSRPVGRLNLAT